jgi:hypothetical protein
VPSKLLKLQSSISLFSLPRIAFEPGSNPLSAFGDLLGRLQKQLAHLAFIQVEVFHKLLPKNLLRWFDSILASNG